ncbi:MAG: 3-oxoadipate enol-lactonase, partial [Comamonas sp.]
MSTTTLHTATGTFRIDLQGPADAPVLVLSNSLGTTLEMWDAQASALSAHWRVLRYDTRGHGGSVC